MTLRTVTAAVLAGVLAAGCATAPKNAQLSADDWRSLTPLQLQFRVHRPKALLPYEPMGESATAAGLGAGQGAVLVLLTLPVWLAVDAGRYGAERVREQRAAEGNARFEGHWAELVQDERFHEAFRRGVSEALPGVAIADEVAPPPAGQLLNPNVLGADMHFALRSDGRALLVHVGLRLPDVPPSFKCKGIFQCADMHGRIGEPRFTTHLFFHSAVLPEPRAAAAAATAARTRPASLYDPSRNARRRAVAQPAGAPRRAELPAYVAMWLEDDRRRLRQAFADAADSVARLTHLAVANQALAGRDSMGPARALFPYAFDDVKFDVMSQEGGRRVLRSRAEPVRGVFGMPDRAAGHWFDVPAAEGKDDPYTQALLEIGPTLRTVYQ